MPCLQTTRNELKMVFKTETDTHFGWIEDMILQNILFRLDGGFLFLMTWHFTFSCKQSKMSKNCIPSSNAMLPPLDTL